MSIEAEPTTSSSALNPGSFSEFCSITGLTDEAASLAYSAAVFGYRTELAAERGVDLDTLHNPFPPQDVEF